MTDAQRLKDQRTADFERERRRLVRLGYRMLGSISEAEDVVQDAWLRFASANGEIDTPAAYLTRVVTRLCLDRAKSARARRETYVGPWLPEPLMSSPESDASLSDELTFTLMVAMERLSPLERAAFLLHDIFNVALGDVAVTLGREPAAVRQLAARARKHLQDARPRFTIEAAEGEKVARAFFAAARDGDTAALSALLAENVEIHTDGGGKVLAFRKVVRGLARALRLFRRAARQTAQQPRLLRTVTIDGLPGYVSLDQRNVLQTTALEIRDGQITAIYILKNPDKLRQLEESDTRPMGSRE